MMPNFTPSGEPDFDAMTKEEAIQFCKQCFNGALAMLNLAKTLGRITAQDDTVSSMEFDEETLEKIRQEPKKAVLNAVELTKHSILSQFHELLSNYLLSKGVAPALPEDFEEGA